MFVIGMKRKPVWLMWLITAMILLAGCAPAAPSSSHISATTMTTSQTATGESSTESAYGTNSTNALSSDTLPSGTATTDAWASAYPSSPTDVGTGARTTSLSGTKASGTSTKSASKTTATSKTTTPVPPPASGEVRGVWVSYIEINNILKGKTTATAPKAVDDAMAKCVSYGMTDVYWHVRSNSDAWYPSSYFPINANVSALIKAGFDPLAYAVKSAHSHGLRLHAWVNPYRIGTNKANARCEDYFSYNNSYYYIPTSDKARQLILNGIRELVQKYSIDGVQFDDYFYPSGCATENTAAAFEKTAYTAYTKSAGSGALNPGSWRRTNVDALMAATYNIVHSKSGCRFGISPSPDVSKNYSQLFANVKRWLSVAGYTDYLCPQVYFGFEHQTAAFDKKVNEWLAYPRSSSVSLYAGIAVYKIGVSPDQYAGTGKNEWATHSDILARSVAYLRSKKLGMAFYSYSFFNPDTARSSTYNKAVAAKEIENVIKEIIVN